MTDNRPAFGVEVRDSIHELLPSALRSLESAKWGRIIVREVHRFLSCIFVQMVCIYIYYIGWFSPLLVFQCKCSDVRCFIFGISLAQALLKLCAKLFSWLSYLIFDHAWARARPGWSVPGQKIGMNSPGSACCWQVSISVLLWYLNGLIQSKELKGVNVVHAIELCR